MHAMLGRGIPVFPGAALLRPQRYVEGGGQQKKPFERVLPGCGEKSPCFQAPTGVVREGTYTVQAAGATLRLPMFGYRFRSSDLCSRATLAAQDVEDPAYKKPSDCRDLKIAKKLSMSRSLV